MDKFREYLPPAEVDIVVYHKNCADGYGAAYIFYRYFKQLGIDNNKEFIAMAHAAPNDLTNRIEILPRLTGKNVVFVDIVPPENVLIECIKGPNRAVALDHHKGMKKTLETYPDLTAQHIYFDISHSGVGLAWEFCYPNNNNIPKFLKLIEDRDIWTKKYEETDSFVTAFYRSVPFQFIEYEQFDEHIAGHVGELNYQRCIDEGRIVLKYQQVELKTNVFPSAVEKHYKFNGKVYGCRLINTSNNISELGEIMCSQPFKNGEKCHFAIMWYFDHNKNCVKVSLRAQDAVDTSDIAKQFKGNGHPNASGFSVTGSQSIVDFMGLY